MKWKWFLLAIAFFYTTAAWAGEALSPYTGQETREIKALSRDEINGYQARYLFLFFVDISTAVVNSCRLAVTCSSSQSVRNHVATSETLLIRVFLNLLDINLFWHMRCSS